MEVRKIDALSLAKVFAVLYAIMGLVFGAFVSVLPLFAGTAATGQSEDALTGVFGVAAVIVFPVLYGVIGFVGCLIMAGLYNRIAGVLGGVRIELREVPPAPSTATT